MLLMTQFQEFHLQLFAGQQTAVPGWRQPVPDEYY